MTYVFFWRSNDVLSQWYESSFSENGIIFFCAEQYMMYHKALLFGDTECASQILKCKIPSMIKHLGRKINNFNQEVWDNNKVDIVTRGNILKFKYLPGVLERYPQDAIFVEASPYDRIWGIGFDAKNALANKDKWGSNLLGNIITHIRKLV